MFFAFKGIIFRKMSVPAAKRLFRLHRPKWAEFKWPALSRLSERSQNLSPTTGDGMGHLQRSNHVVQIAKLESKWRTGTCWTKENSYLVAFLNISHCDSCSPVWRFAPRNCSAAKGPFFHFSSGGLWTTVDLCRVGFPPWIHYRVSCRVGGYFTEIQLVVAFRFFGVLHGRRIQKGNFAWFHDEDIDIIFQRVRFASLGVDFVL